jgi:hypothetical protein
MNCKDWRPCRFNWFDGNLAQKEKRLSIPVYQRRRRFDSAKGRMQSQGKIACWGARDFQRLEIGFWLDSGVQFYGDAGNVQGFPAFPSLAVRKKEGSWSILSIIFRWALRSFALHARCTSIARCNRPSYPSLDPFDLCPACIDFRLLPIKRERAQPCFVSSSLPFYSLLSISSSSSDKSY